MQLIKPGTNIDFIGKRKIAFVVSIILIAISLGSIFFHKGLRYGIDFAGGTLVQVQFSGPVTVDQIRKGLAPVGLESSSVQRMGYVEENEFLIRADTLNANIESLSEKLELHLSEATGVSADVRKLDMVGPQVGHDLRGKALLAIFYSLLFITVYISGRFEQQWIKSGVVVAIIIGSVYALSLLGVSIPYLMLAATIVSLFAFWFFGFNYSMGAIICQMHDVIVVVGVFSLCGKEFTLPVVAALLTVVGYSLNDTIIIFDRIRENIRKYHKEPMVVILNRSVNDTLSRTILTSGSTLFVVLAMFFLGGSIIHDFSFALIIGVVVGTISSIYVAAPIMMLCQPRRK
ncbi:protein translocase subunit SecF [Desulfosarcina sp. OttesenSCG-928-A07]|nr:protein translocase subunit SecF [Desulfosarcina sp. OttesenSCG-928-G17]MDL2328402.1 protein translocase subunit SecF [Desulfosarcina sp. OttesenSCG-928-A07]